MFYARIIPTMFLGISIMFLIHMARVLWLEHKEHSGHEHDPFGGVCHSPEGRD